MNTAIAEKKSTATGPTLSSVAELRANARRKIEEGAVTAGYSANREQVLKMLNEALGASGTGLSASSFLQEANKISMVVAESQRC